MKKLITSIMLALTMIVAPVLIIGCSGCKNTSVTRNTYVASGVTHVGAVSGLRGWNEYLRLEYIAIDTLSETDAPAAEKRKAKVLEQEKQVADAWAKYQASQIAVLTAAQEFSRVPVDDPQSANAQDRLNAAVAASSVTLGEVIKLLQQFGIAVK